MAAVAAVVVPLRGCAAPLLPASRTAGARRRTAAAARVETRAAARGAWRRAVGSKRAGSRGLRSGHGTREVLQGGTRAVLHGGTRAARLTTQLGVGWPWRRPQQPAQTPPRRVPAVRAQELGALLAARRSGGRRSGGRSSGACCSSYRGGSARNWHPTLRKRWAWRARRETREARAWRRPHQARHQARGGAQGKTRSLWSSPCERLLRCCSSVPIASAPS